MHELQQILLQKLPRLGELTFGCEVKNKLGRVGKVLWKTGRPEGSVMILKGDLDSMNFGWIDDLEILGHPFTHADILEALGEDWAMGGNYKIWEDLEPSNKFYEYIQLPQNLSDLSLPEYEETRARLISLLK